MCSDGKGAINENTKVQDSWKTLIYDNYATNLFLLRFLEKS